MKHLFILLFAHFVFMGCNGQKPELLKINDNNNTLLWQVSGKGLSKPSYLFGTFHLLCKEDIHFSEQLKKAIQRCDTVYMEMDLDDPSTMLSGMLYMNMKGGKKLKDLYSEKDYQKLESYFADSLKIPLTFFSGAKPYFLVALFYPRMMSCSSPSGVEQELLKIIKENKKEVNGLETMQFQASVFDSIPYEWQAKELMKSIDSFAVAKNEFDRMLKIYKSQELDSMTAMFVENEFGADEFSKYLLDNRNKNWVNQLNKIMKNESVFVAVGAGHLVGDVGLINLLRKEGYTVEPLKNK
ncbi:MAG: TraB/GumN family protein [Ginsengibacter sp.]